MSFKPFKSPLLVNPGARPSTPSSEPPSKRRKISIGETRKPLAVLKNTSSPEDPTQSSGSNGISGYFLVLWRKFTTKKHKTWEDEGVLAVSGGYASLQDMSGRHIGRTAFNMPLLVGSTLSLGGKELEVDSIITKEDYQSGRPFLKAGKLSEAKNDDENMHQQATVKPTMSIQAQMKAQMLKEKEKSKKMLNIAAPKSCATKSAFRNPVLESTVMPQVAGPKPVPRHDPDAPNALVMKRPNKVPKGKQIVDVVLDPILNKHLRDHQREGVKFLYECVMGLRDFGGEGCILADEMGLGKTLQTIALLWTLLKQNPIYGDSPVIKKALIVCPVTLINNWQKEFRKWLGNERIGVFVADGKKTRLTDFTMGKSYNIMIIGYERLRSVAEDLTKGSGIDIVVADEGHRLKTVQNKSAQAIQSLNTPKRVILSGTPIQNDLSEFFSMVNFVNDGLLGTYKAFMKNFEAPIVRSRQPDAISKHIELGEARSEELAETTSPFILRRTADILSSYLPPKSEYVLFCKPTPVQANIYRHVVASPMFQCVLGSSESALQLITILKKLCNSPSLLNSRTESGETSTSTSVTNLLATLPPDLLKVFGNAASTKIRILDNLLHNIRHQTDEKVVLVSNYTSTLDLLQTLLTSTGLPFLRLDGSTPAKQRQGLVDEFNRATTRTHFAFLLSAKAGGMGINLIGASRLILFDVDWNPATDDQAMARIHREGQRRHCKIYRFLIKGGLEERIWQRQVVKRGLADSILEGGGAGAGAGGSKNGVAQFSREELRDLFRLDENEGLRTHELIGCLCNGTGNAGDFSVSRKEDDDDDKPYFVDDSAASENEDDELPDMSALIKASELTNAALEKQELKISSGTHHVQANAKKKEGQDMQSLMLYSHIDTARFPLLHNNSDELERMEEIIDDECLMGVLRGEEGEGVVGGVAYVFKKTSKSKVEHAVEDGTVRVVEGGLKSSFFK